MTCHDCVRFGLMLVPGAAVCAVFALLPTGRAQPPAAPVVTPYSLETPPTETIAKALRDLQAADVGLRKAAVAELARHAEAEPYLRDYCNSFIGLPDKLARQALDALEVNRAKRNVARAERWAEEGRYDLLVDLSLHLTDTAQVDTVAKAFFDFAKKARWVPTKFGGAAARHNLAYDMVAFAKNPMFQRFHAPDDIISTDWMSHAFVRAQSCRTSAITRFNWLVLTRDELIGTNKRNNLWEDCYIFHNGDFVFEDSMTSLFVCDGDVEIAGIGSMVSSTIIASGSVRSRGSIGFGDSTIFAGGDIVAPKGSGTSMGLLMAGGKIDVLRSEAVKDRIGRVEKAGVKDNPFGVRFFQTADIGVELVAKGEAVSIAKLTAGSPLTRYGLQTGDVVTKLNDKAIKKVQDLRRELRYSVALEAGIFHVRRGNQKLTRVVYFKNGLEK